MRILNNLNLAGNELQNARIQNLVTAPSNPVVGQMYFNTSEGTNTLYVWNGTAWMDALKQGTTLSAQDVLNLIASVETEGSGLDADMLDGKHASDFQTKINVTGLVKGIGADSYVAAIAGTDYAPATSGTGILKGNGSGGFVVAVAGTDYAPATSGNGVLKGDGNGGFTDAQSGTDFAPPTSGTGILKGNGSGGFVEAVAGTDYAAVAHEHKLSEITDVNYNGAYVENKINIAVLGSDGMIPSANLPSYVDDVVDVITVTGTAPQTASVGDKYANTTDNKIYTWLSSSAWDSGVAAETGKIYVSVDTAHQWRFSGSTLVDISAGAATLHKYTGVCVGDGSTSTFTINHGLNTRDVMINIYDNTTNETVMVDTTRISAVAITVEFAVAPQVGEDYKVVIVA